MKRAPPLWLRNWAALQGLTIVDASDYEAGHRGDWYLQKWEMPTAHLGMRYMFVHDNTGFYVWKRCSRQMFLLSPMIKARNI